MKLFLGFWFFLFGIIGISSQNTFRVEGKVVDFHNNAILQDTEIEIGSWKTTSTKEGTFSFNSIEKGTYILRATHPECDLFEEKIVVDKPIYITLRLEHHIATIEEVHLSGVPKIKGAINVKTLNKEEISRNSTENLGNMLSSISGVNTLKTGNNIAKPVIHGLYGSRILVYNNGVRMAEQEWGVEHSPSVDANAFERIRVIKGGGTLKYGGDAIGGVVTLEPQKFPAKDSIAGNVIVSGISNGRGGKVVADIVGMWENNWFLRSNGTFKKLGNISIPTTTLRNTGAEEYAFSLGTGYRSFDKGIEFTYNGISQEFGIFQGSHLGATEEFVDAVEMKKIFYTGDFSYKIDNPKQQIAHHLAKIETYKRFEDLGKITFQYAFQLNRRKEYDIRRAEYNQLPSMDLRLITHSAKVEHLIEREKWSLESGIIGSIQDNFPDPTTKARRLIPDYYRYDVGVFSHFQYHFNEKLKTELGVRYDLNIYDAYKYYDESEWNDRFSNTFPDFEVKKSGSRILTRPQFNFHNVSANLGFSYSLSNNFLFSLNVARAARTPNAAELFADGLHHSASIIERGNLMIKPETIHQVNFSARGKLDVLKGLQIELNPYFMKSENFINQVPTGAMITIRGVFPVWDYQQIKAEMYGLDVDSELKILENLNLDTKFSMVKGKDLSHNEPLILMAPMNFRNSLTFEIPNFQKLYFKAENVWVAQQKDFPIRNINVSIIKDGAFIQKELDVSSTPPSYSLWNFSAGMNVAKNLNLNVNVQNIFNTEYRDYLNRLRFFAPEAGRNFIVSLKYSF